MTRIGQLGDQDLDPYLLMWDIRRAVPVHAWPRDRTVLAFRFDDVDARVARWWLMVSGPDVDVCDYDPGFEVTGTLRISLRSLTEVWRGDRSWEQLLRTGTVVVDGPTSVRRAVPTWLGQSPLALVPRPA